MKSKVFPGSEIEDQEGTLYELVLNIPKYLIYKSY